MKKERIRVLQKGKEKKGPILYWMSRDQRVNDNWALIHAQQIALTRKEPFLVIFFLMAEFLGAMMRQYDFFLSGLQEISKELEKLNIPFIIVEGTPQDKIPRVIEKYNISQIICDFSPLKIKKDWLNGITKKLDIPIAEVDAHNIIPCWKASNKKEYAAYTLRPKIKKLLPKYLDSFPDIKPHPIRVNYDVPSIDFRKLKSFLKVDKSINKIKWLSPGEDAAHRVLDIFLKTKFRDYRMKRNDPNEDATSNLSPYLHFGQISAQRIVLECQEINPISNLKGTFYDEIIVRRELSDNYCFYESNYDSFEGFPNWAQKTLKKHKTDKREYLYNLKEFERAKTHDNAWNAAQNQMVKTGKMHGYMRMYWAKKILEWTETSNEAMRIAIALNDKYELDGRDPNGYTGIAWSIGGVHDRAWNERKIFGKVRYMSFQGLKRKFDINQYIDKYADI
ncbi:MAG: deoxyribodipyrimidine photo-lyase [Candidatus Lokiarchaeota archaeon]|nr:deoxyribodipyrimidine photo-lyase [Candidatus Lokiarchaeota archaeon]MBD3341431.1 deoxyribodipyrimidine photo-lyase [Candidatus Lokiarchaeota archaeon]